MIIETINGVEYLKMNGNYYKLCICDMRQIKKSIAFEKRNNKNELIRKMIAHDYESGICKNELTIKYKKSGTRINQILKKEGVL